jgi:hypothetical protein
VGKYSHLNLPKYIDPDAKYQEKVRAVKDQIGRAADVGQAGLLTDIAKRMVALGEHLNVINQDLIRLAGGKPYATLYAVGYRESRFVKEALKEHAKAIELTLEAYQQLAIGQLEVEGGVTSLKLADGSTFRVQDEVYVGVVDKEAFRKWCIAAGLEMSLQLWPGTTTSMTKERLIAGEPEPDGVKAYMKPKVVFSAGSGTSEE